MRNWETTRFSKVIRLTVEHSNYVDKIRKKKSRAGMLEEIIDSYMKKKEKQNKHSNYVAVTEHSNYVEKSEGNKVIDIFYEINKTIDYKKPFERRAADELIKIYGLEKVLRVARFACQVRGMPYAPRISKPTELKEKWADLETFALTKKNEAQSKQIIEV